MKRTLVLLVTTLALLSLASGVRAAQEDCGSAGGVEVCLSVPDGPLVGDVPVSAEATGPTPYVLVFTWNGEDLLTDFKEPWEFTWPTAHTPNGTGVLRAAFKPRGGEVGPPVVGLQLTIANPAPAPPRPADWASIFRPRVFGGDPVIAAVGDGGDGTARSERVAQSILDSQAGILLFLGDMYDTGSYTEWDYNFGRASYDDPAGGRGWGRLASFTKPALGNHEAQHLDAWGDYWHHRPYWETFVWGGVRFLVLDSECQQAGGCGTESAQYKWARQVLVDNTYPCVVATWHRPILAPRYDDDHTTALWGLLARHGGDLVLNGHQHDMEAYQPLDENLDPGGHLVQLVAGSGGHIPHQDEVSDGRGTWQARNAQGAVYLSAVGGSGGTASQLRWQYRDQTGRPVRDGAGTVGEGTVRC